MSDNELKDIFDAFKFGFIIVFGSMSLITIIYVIMVVIPCLLFGFPI